MKYSSGVEYILSDISFVYDLAIIYSSGDIQILVSLINKHFKPGISNQCGKKLNPINLKWSELMVSFAKICDEVIYFLTNQYFPWFYQRQLVFY